jgi:hypothetical protein
MRRLWIAFVMVSVIGFGILANWTKVQLAARRRAASVRKRLSMSGTQRRKQNGTVRTRDTRTTEAAGRHTVTGPSSEGAEESRQDPYRDEGGES